MNRESIFYLILFGVLVMVPELVAAQVTPPAKPATRTAEPLGRLFFTPAQRASLDVARTQRARTTLSTEATSEENAAPAAQSITYGGMVRRSDGKSTVWINGRPVSDNDPASGAAVVGSVRPDGGVSLVVPQSGRRIDLKPGQSVELLSGAIEEGFSRKPVAPEPRPAAKSDAGGKTAGKTEPVERGVDARGREEREQQRVDEAVARALQDAAAKPSAGPSPAPERPR